MNCPPYPNGQPNLNCLCADTNFFNGIRDCAYGACNVYDAENTLGLVAIYCTDRRFYHSLHKKNSPFILVFPSYFHLSIHLHRSSIVIKIVSTNTTPSKPAKYQTPNYPCPAALLLPGTDSDGTNNNANGNNNANNGNNNANGAAPRVDVITYYSAGNAFVATVTISPAANGNNGNNNNLASTNANGSLRTATAYVSPTAIGGGNTAFNNGGGGVGGNTNVVASQTGGGTAGVGTGKVDYGNNAAATSSTSISGAGPAAQETTTNSAGAKETGKEDKAGATNKAAGVREIVLPLGNMRERVLAVALGFVMVL